MVRIARRISDRGPPPLPVGGAPAPARCARCGEPIDEGDRDGSATPRHVVCDPVERRALARRIEAGRAIHRAIAALGAVPAVQARIAEDVAALPDAAGVGEALAFLGRARTVVECSAEMSAQQRRVALSLIDSAVRRLEG